LNFRDSLSEQWIDLRLIAGMRVVLGTSALLISVLSNTETRPWALPVDVALVLYSLYGLVLYHLSVRRNPVAAHKLIAWLDLLWYLPLIAFAGAGNGTFYYFFFFSIVVASFNWGLNEGLRLTLASAIICTLVGILNAPRNSPWQHNNVMLAPIGLLTFGYLIARWGGYHTALKNRFRLLKEVTAVSNPRYGIDRTIKAILESTRAFYDAEACLLVIPGKPGVESYLLYRVTRGTTPSRSAPPEIAREAAALPPPRRPSGSRPAGHGTSPCPPCTTSTARSRRCVRRPRRTPRRARRRAPRAGRRRRAFVALCGEHSSAQSLTATAAATTNGTPRQEVRAPDRKNAV
jgi:hypothetical protein